MTARYDALAEMVNVIDRDHERWEPAEGDKVAGQVADIQQVEGKFGPFTVLTIDAVDGRLVDVSCFRNVLANEVARRDVRVGDLLVIKYEGLKTSNTGATYHAYSMVHRPASEPARLTDGDATVDADVGVELERKTVVTADSLL